MVALKSGNFGGWDFFGRARPAIAAAVNRAASREAIRWLGHSLYTRVLTFRTTGGRYIVNSNGWPMMPTNWGSVTSSADLCYDRRRAGPHCVRAAHEAGLRASQMGLALISAYFGTRCNAAG